MSSKGFIQGGKATSLTPQEVARSVNVSKATVLAAIRKNELQAWRPAPNLLRIQPEHVVEWIESRSNKKDRPVRSSTSRRLRALEGGHGE